MTTPAPLPQPVVTVTRKPGMRTTDKLLAAILAVLVLLVAAVVLLGVVVYSATRPVLAPTGPTRHVKVSVVSQQANGTAVFSDASGISTVAIRGNLTDQVSQSRESDVAFGGTVEVTMLLTSMSVDDQAIEQNGILSCQIEEGNTTRANTILVVVGGRASCRWTNDGT